MDKYQQFKKQNEGKFFIPEEHIFWREISNTPEYIRKWFQKNLKP